MSTDRLDLLRERARAGIAADGEPRIVATPLDLHGIVRALAPLLPADGGEEIWDTGPGRVYPDGSGHVADRFPYGGSVIEGYHERLTIVLANGAVVLGEQLDLSPSAGYVTVHGDVPAGYLASLAR